MSHLACRDVDEHPVAWREAGRGQPVVLLHGLGLSRTSWDPFLAGLADRWRVIAWDAPGYGASPPAGEPLSFAGLARAVVELADRLDAERVHLAGLSWGGMIALHTAIDHPDRVASLALFDSSPAFGLDGTRADEWVRARLGPLDEGATPAEMAGPVLAAVGGPTIGADALAAGVASMARITPEGLRAAVTVLPSHDVRDRLGRIGAPTLVVVGEVDHETPVPYAEALVAGIPEAGLVVLPDTGHLSTLERPAETVSLLRGHLEAACS